LKDKNGEDGHVPTVLRLLLVVEELTRIGRPATPTEINEAIGFPKSTIHRLCETLEQEGFLSRDVDGNRYMPGARLQTLATGILSSQRLVIARQSILRALAEEVGETCNICIPDGDTMLYIDRIESHWPLRIQLPVGTHVPLHCTASGKLYLSSLTRAHLDRYLASAPLDRRAPNTILDPDSLKAELSRIREQGYAVDDEEFMEAMVAIAVPLFDGQGRMCATLAVHGPAPRLSVERLVGFLPRLISTAAEITQLSLDAE